MLASGSLANQASPMQADIAPSPDQPKVDGFTPSRAFDDITTAVQSCLARADGVAQAALGESLESFLRRFEALPVESATPAPDPRPLGVGQSARKPA